MKKTIAFVLLFFSLVCALRAFYGYDFSVTEFMRFVSEVRFDYEPFINYWYSFKSALIDSPSFAEFLDLLVNTFVLFAELIYSILDVIGSTLNVICYIFGIAPIF